MSRIVEVLNQAKEKFISVNEAVHMLAKEGEGTPIQAATFLLHHDADKALTGYRMDDAFRLYEVDWEYGRYDAVFCALHDFMSPNAPKINNDGRIIEIGEEVGWKRVEFVDFALIEFAIDLDIRPKGSTTSQIKPPPRPSPVVVVSPDLLIKLAEAEQKAKRLEQELTEKDMHICGLEAYRESAQSHEEDLAEAEQEIGFLNERLAAVTVERDALRAQLEAVSEPATMPPLIRIAIEVFQEHWHGQIEPDENTRARTIQNVITKAIAEKYPRMTKATVNAVEKVASPIDRDRSNPSEKYPF
jgi:hypothetical protein